MSCISPILHCMMRPAASLVGIAEYRDFNAPRDTHSADVLSHITKNLNTQNCTDTRPCIFPRNNQHMRTPHRHMHLHTWLASSNTTHIAASKALSAANRCMPLASLAA
jgi:hypothetical protein